MLPPRYARDNVRTTHTLLSPAKPGRDELAYTTLHKEQHRASENRLRGPQLWYLVQAETIPTGRPRHVEGKQKRGQSAPALPLLQARDQGLYVPYLQHLACRSIEEKLRPAVSQQRCAP